MDVTGLDLAQLGTAVGAIAAALKAMKGNRDIVRARTETRTERNVELQKMQLQIVELQTEHRHAIERLNNGDARFDKIESKIDGVMIRQDRTNSELAELKGILKRALGEKSRADD